MIDDHFGCGDECTACEGEGNVDCCECDGAGCIECDSTGEMDCERCEGSGEVSRESARYERECFMADEMRDRDR